MNRLLFLALTLALVAIVTFSTFEPKKTQEIATLEIPNNIDYYFKNTLQKSFKTDGTIDFTLSSDLIKHYKKEDKSIMLKPDVLITRLNIWQIKAQQGDFFHPEEMIHFSEKVLLDKKNKASMFQVEADTLLFNIQQDLVISESNVKVTADSWHLNAKTMSIDMKNEIHQFTHVTARYRHDKNT